MTPINNYVNKNIPQQHFLFLQLRESPPLLNAILKTLNFSFAQKEDFLRKLSNISITLVYLLFSIMLKYTRKNHYNRSRDARLYNFWGETALKFSTSHKKEQFLRNYIRIFQEFLEYSIIAKSLEWILRCCKYKHNYLDTYQHT